jgi:hypothetical protein
MMNMTDAAFLFLGNFGDKEGGVIEVGAQNDRPHVTTGSYDMLMKSA